MFCNSNNNSNSDCTLPCVLTKRADQFHNDNEPMEMLLAAQVATHAHSGYAQAHLFVCVCARVCACVTEKRL